MSLPSCESSEQQGVKEFRLAWPQLQNSYTELSKFVVEKCRDMLCKSSPRIYGHIEPRPGDVKTLESAVKTLNKKVNLRNKRFPDLASVIKELDDLAGVTIATNSAADWKRIQAWIDSNFVATKDLKDWKSDPSVYKHIEPIFSNYQALHLRVKLGEPFLLEKRHLKDLQIEIQVKTEDMASTNRVIHDIQYKGVIPLSKNREKIVDAMMGLHQSMTRLKEYMNDKMVEQTMPFSENSKMVKILNRHGFDFTYARFFRPLELALQVASADSSTELEILCQQAKNTNPGDFTVLTGLVRNRCQGSIDKTEKFVKITKPRRARYRAWILANLFVFLKKWNMENVIASAIIYSGFQAEEVPYRLSCLLAFLNCAIKPTDDQCKTLRLLWRSVGKDPLPDIEPPTNVLYVLAVVRIALDFIKLGVYPTISIDPASKYHLELPAESRVILNSIMQHRSKDQLAFSWPSTLGAPSSEETLPLEPCLGIHQHLKPTSVYLPLCLTVTPEANNRNAAESSELCSGNMLLPKIAWVKYHFLETPESWGYSVLYGPNANHKQETLQKFCMIADYWHELRNEAGKEYL